MPDLLMRPGESCTLTGDRRAPCQIGDEGQQQVGEDIEILRHVASLEPVRDRYFGCKIKVLRSRHDLAQEIEIFRPLRVEKFERAARTALRETHGPLEFIAALLGHRLDHRYRI